MDIQQQLERDIGHGPALPTPQQRLAAGRAALRRRRVTVAAGAAAVLVVIATPFALGAAGDTQSPALTAPPSPSATSEADPEDWRGTGGVQVQAGTLRISPDAVVHERRDGVVPGYPSSAALDLTFQGERTWRVTRPVGGGSWMSITSTPGEEESGLYRDFDDFVAKATFCFRQGVNPLSGPGSLVLDDIDGMPQVAGAGMAIGPVVRDDQRAFGFEVESGEGLQFVLLQRVSGDSWRVERIEAAASGDDLASWLRGLGWLPTGEEGS